MTGPRRYPLVLAAVAVYIAVVLLGTKALASPGPAAEYRSATTASVTYELRTLTRWRVERVGELAAEPPEDGISGDLLLGIGSRETNMRNIVGGGHFDASGKFVPTGEDRGMFQLNQTFQAAFLSSHRGATSGSWTLIYSSALPAGRVPGLTDATRHVISILRGNVAYATRFGVPPADAVRVAVAGYNSGIGPATSAYLVNGNPDRYTTGGDYSRDVLDRRAKIRRARRDLHYR